MGWIPDVVPDQTISSTAWGNLIRDRVVQVFDSVADRNANAVVREGMLAWARAEHRLSVWVDSTTSWVTVLEPYRTFTPRLWIGATEFGINAIVSTGFRLAYGACSFFLSASFGTLGPDQVGDISILPPVQPRADANGGFGVMYVSPMDAAAPEVGFGLFNGTTGLPGAPYPGQLAIGSPRDGRLLNRADLLPNGVFNAYASGSFPTVVAE